MEIKVKINKTADAEVELEGEIAATDFGSFWPKAIKTLGEKAKIDGFRPGHIPEKVLELGLGMELELLILILKQVHQRLVEQLQVLL